MLKNNMANPLKLSFAPDTMPWWKRGIVRSFERALLGNPAKKIMDKVTSELPVYQSFLDHFGHNIRSNIKEIELPESGPLIFVSNHPYGIQDVAAAFALGKQVRPDMKAIANAFALQIPGIGEDVFPVDFNGTQNAQRTNRRTILNSLKHLRSGGSLAMSPSGWIMTTPGFFDYRAEEGTWSESLGFLARNQMP